MKRRRCSWCHELIEPWYWNDYYDLHNNQTSLIEEIDNMESTFGEKAMGVKFNPSGDEKVAKLKELYAQIADVLNDDRGQERDERARLTSIAITEAQGAQMWAVKAVTTERGA